MVDQIPFHREKSVAFEVYGPPPSFGQRTDNFRYRSVMNNRLIDRSKPYYIPDYYISIFDGETQKIAYEHRYQNADFENKHVGDQESEFDVYDQFGRGLATIPLDTVNMKRSFSTMGTKRKPCGPKQDGSSFKAMVLTARLGWTAIVITVRTNQWWV